jgi:hypothetical protein
MLSGVLIFLLVVVGWAAFLAAVAVGVHVYRHMRRDVSQLKTQIEEEQIRQRDELLHAIAGHSRAGSHRQQRHLRLLKSPAIVLGLGAAWEFARKHAIPLTGLAAAATTGGLILAPAVQAPGAATPTPHVPSSTVVPSAPASTVPDPNSAVARPPSPRPVKRVPASPTTHNPQGLAGTSTPSTVSTPTATPTPVVSTAGPLAPVTSAAAPVTSAVPSLPPTGLPVTSVLPTVCLKLPGHKHCI